MKSCTTLIHNIGLTFFFCLFFYFPLYCRVHVCVCFSFAYGTLCNAVRTNDLYTDICLFLVSVWVHIHIAFDNQQRHCVFGCDVI